MVVKSPTFLTQVLIVTLGQKTDNDIRLCHSCRLSWVGLVTYAGYVHQQKQKKPKIQN